MQMYKGLFKVFMITIISLGFSYCSSNNSSQKISFNTSNKNAEELSAKIAINGMTCKHACVSTINKTLKNIDGVKDITIDFDENKTTDFAFVTFDPKTTSPEALMKSIENIGDGLYAVEYIEISDASKSNSKNNINNTEDINSTKIVIPQLNILLSLINFFGSLQASL